MTNFCSNYENKNTLKNHKNARPKWQEKYSVKRHVEEVCGQVQLTMKLSISSQIYEKLFFNKATFVKKCLPSSVYFPVNFCLFSPLSSRLELKALPYEFSW